MIVLLVLTLKYTKNCYSSGKELTFDKLFLSQTNPIKPEIKEPINIINFEFVIIWWSSNAKSVTKMDMVKPIPPRNPIPIIFFQFKSSGKWVNFNFTDKYVKRKIPIGFQRTSPKMIPNE